MKKIMVILLIIIVVIITLVVYSKKIGNNFDINQFSKDIIGKEYTVDTYYNDVLTDGSTAKGSLNWKIKFVDSEKISISFNHKYEWYIFEEDADLKMGTSNTEKSDVDQLNLEYKLEKNGDTVKANLHYNDNPLPKDNKLKLQNEQWNTSFPIVETYFDINDSNLKVYESETVYSEPKLTDEQFTKAYNRTIEKAKEKERLDKLKNMYDMNSKPYIGTTESSVINKWGKPKYKNVTVTPSGKVEQWVYNGDRYVYVQDGIVTAVQYEE